MADLDVPETRGFNRYLIEALELENMLITASMVAESAIIREESRGHTTGTTSPRPGLNGRRA